MAMVRGTQGTYQAAQDVRADGSRSEIRQAWVGGSSGLVFQTYWSADMLRPPGDTDEVRLTLQGLARDHREFATMEIWRGDIPHSGVAGPAILQAGARPHHVSHEMRWGELRALVAGDHVTIAAVSELGPVLARGRIGAAMFDEPSALTKALGAALDAQLRDPRRKCRVVKPEGEIVVT